MIIDKIYLIAEDNIIFHPAEKDQVEGHIDHPQVGTHCMQVAKDTGG